MTDKAATSLSICAERQDEANRYKKLAERGIRRASDLLNARRPNSNYSYLQNQKYP